MRGGGETPALARADGDQPRQELLAGNLRTDTDGHHVRFRIVGAFRNQIGDENRGLTMIGDIVFDGKGDVRRKAIAIDFGVDPDIVLGADNSAGFLHVNGLCRRAGDQQKQKSWSGVASHGAFPLYAKENARDDPNPFQRRADRSPRFRGGSRLSNIPEWSSEERSRRSPPSGRTCHWATAQEPTSGSVARSAWRMASHPAAQSL